MLGMTAMLACSDVHAVVPREVLGLEVEGDADRHKEGGVCGVHEHRDDAPRERKLGHGVDCGPPASVPAQPAVPQASALAGTSTACGCLICLCAEGTWLQRHRTGALSLLSDAAGPAWSPRGCGIT